MNVLDDGSTYDLDKSGMFTHIRELGNGLSSAWRQSADLEIPGSFAQPNALVVAGIGGSAASGDYLAALCADTSPIPVLVVREAQLPHWVNANTLVVAVSYGGDTVETLGLYEQAKSRGSRLIAITNSGDLLRRATHDGFPVHRIDYASAPRAALGHSLAPLLRIASLLGLCEIDDLIVGGAVTTHARTRAVMLPEVQTEENPAKQFAVVMVETFPYILAGEHLVPVARRLRNQLAENGKLAAASESVPEAMHNLVEGLLAPRAGLAPISLLSLDSQLYAEATSKSLRMLRGEGGRMGLSALLLGGRASPSRLADMLAATAWADYVSCYVGLLRGVDPTPIDTIRKFKVFVPQTS